MKINLTTLGCPKNIVDSEYLLAGLQGQDVEMVENPQVAETIILNTCGFIQGAKEESIEAILQAVELKKTGPCQWVFVTGCLSQRYRHILKKEIPEVDGFYGNRDLNAILNRILKNLNLKRELLGERTLITPAHYAYLKISEGCENPCTFCSIPEIRGKFMSRPLESLVEEAQNLAELGVRELLLIAQDSTVYGQDLYGKKMLAPLLEQLMNIKKIKWIRLLYTYPAHFSDELFEILSDRNSIIKYIDMPIQHVSNKILKSMARKVTRTEIEHIIARLRKHTPAVAIRTSLIVGFPGETEEAHQEMAEFLEAARFTRLGLFAFSREENTPAYEFPDQIPEQVKQERWAELNDIQAQISYEMNRELLGTTQEVLIDEFDAATGLFRGRTFRDCPEIDNSVVVEGVAEVGQFYPVKITQAHDYELSGELIVR
ncbi:MAG: 30S ribosomal protein S12 methylthiotransferase RimO [bacterium]